MWTTKFDDLVRRLVTGDAAELKQYMFLNPGQRIVTYLLMYQYVPVLKQC